jgi:hypothetical protein
VNEVVISVWLGRKATKSIFYSCKASTLYIERTVIVAKHCATKTKNASARQE